MDRYTLKMRGTQLSQQQLSSSPCNTKHAIATRGSPNSSSTTNSAPKRAPERRGPDAATLLSQLNQLDELATFATNSSIRKASSAHSCADDNRSIIQISGSSSQDDIDHIVQAVSSKLSISHSVGSVASESYRGTAGPTRSIGSEGTSSYYSNRNVLSNTVVTSASRSLAAKASSTVKSSVGPMLSNSSDDVELSATKWYTRRRTTSVDSVEDSSSEGSDSQHQIYSDDEIFDFGKKILNDHSESSESHPEHSPRRPKSWTSGSSTSGVVMPKKSLDFDDVWEDGEADTAAEAERLTLLQSATTESTETEEDELGGDDDSVSSSSCEEEIEEYESDDGSSDLFEERSIPPPPPVQPSTSIKSHPCESSTLESPITPENAAKTENASDSAEDYSDDEDEGEEGYKLGGYHPVKNGEVYNQRLVLVCMNGFPVFLYNYHAAH